MFFFLYYTFIAMVFFPFSAPSIIMTDLYMSPAERLVVFDRWGLGSPARLMSEGKKKTHILDHKKTKRYLNIIYL